MPKIDTTVGHLVDMIERGELRLPELQRRYVWPATRVRDLLDSLYRNYPSGTILVWETDQEVPSRDLAVRQTVGAFIPKLLLDGQQRLTSLSAIIRGEPIRIKGKVRPIHIAFNLDHPEGPPIEVMEVEDDDQSLYKEQSDDTSEESGETPSLQERLLNRTFVVGFNSLFADPRWVRVSDIFKGERTDWNLIKGLVTSPDDPKFDMYTKRLQRVRRIREYPYVMHVLDRSLPYEEVAEIFVRVNSLGMKLRGSDLALAQITARWPNSLQMFEDFAEECERSGFTFDTGLLVRTVVAFATRQSRFGAAATIPVPTLIESWERAKDGLRFAMDFLRSNAGIEDESLLSSPMLVIPIAVLAVLRRHQLTQTEERDLRYWLLMANAKGHFSVSAETILDTDLRILLIREGGPAELLETLRQQVGRTTFAPSDFANRSVRHPLFPVVYLALKQLGAKDWQSGLGLSLAHSARGNAIDFHHIFPRSVLTRTGHELSEINEIANMAFISGSVNRALSNKEPREYFPAVIEKRGQEALTGQLIPLDPSLWEINNYRSFLEVRRTSLARVLNSFFNDINANKRLAVDARDLIEAGESSSLEFKSSARFNYHTKVQDSKLEGVIIKAIAGFMNAGGGTLLIGVNDAGMPVGITPDLETLQRNDTDGYQQFLTNLIIKSIGKERSPDVSISFQPIEDVKVCLIRVEPSHKPAYVSDGIEQRFYVRIGNTTHPLSTKEAVEYISQHWH